MADTSIVSQAELEAISLTSGFAIWELEQVVADGNFRFLVDEFRAGRLGQTVDPQQAPPPPSVVGQLTESAAVGLGDINQALSEGVGDVVATLKSVGITSGILVVGIGLLALFVFVKAKG
jgi:hypothetical protein